MTKHKKGWIRLYPTIEKTSYGVFTLWELFTYGEWSELLYDNILDEPPRGAVVEGDWARVCLSGLSSKQIDEAICAHVAQRR